jgi:hypothetical protein
MRINQLNARLHSSSSSSSSSSGVGDPTAAAAAAVASDGSYSADEDHHHHDHAPHEVLSPLRLNTESAAGGVRLRFRRKTPMFQVRAATAAAGTCEDDLHASSGERATEPACASIQTSRV